MTENKKKKQVLIISQYFPPDISGGGTRAFNYAKCLSEKYDVTVITAFPHLHSRIPKKYHYRFLVKETMDNFNVIRVKVPSILHDSIKNRIILHLSFITSSLFPIFSLKPDIIFASEPNLFSIIPSFLYSKLRGGKVIRVVDDLWPEVIYERGFFKSKIFQKILNRFTKFSYDYPKYILPLTSEAKGHIQKFYDVPSEKIVVIEHGVDPTFKFTEKKREEDFVVMYSGALVDSYDLDLLLDTASEFKEKNIKFVIRGKGNLLTKLKIKKDKMKLDNVKIDSSIIEFDKISKVLSTADVFVVPMKDDYFLNLSLPTKILEFQALGRPIICCSNGAPGNYVAKIESGFKIKPKNLEELKNSITHLQSDPQLCKKFGQNGRLYVEKNLTIEQIGTRLSDLIERTVSKKT